MVNPLSPYLAAKGETAVSFAARAGISLDTLRSYLSGRRTPGTAAAVAIERATAGEVPVESWLDTGEPEAPKDDSEAA